MYVSSCNGIDVSIRDGFRWPIFSILSKGAENTIDAFFEDPTANLWVGIW